MKKTFLALALGALSVVTTLRAESIDWTALSTGPGSVPLHLSVTSGGAAVPVGSIAYVGQFPAGFDFTANTSLNSLLNAFTLMDTVFVGTDEAGGSNLGAGQFYGAISGTPLPGTVNAGTGAPATPVNGGALYMWVFNASTPQAATQWGIIRQNPADTWVFNTGSSAAAFLDVSETGVNVPTGALGQMIGGELFLGNAVVVPEPSTYVLGLFAGATLVAFRRRMKK